MSYLDVYMRAGEKLLGICSLPHGDQIVLSADLNPKPPVVGLFLSVMISSVAKSLQVSDQQAVQRLLDGEIVIVDY